MSDASGFVSSISASDCWFRSGIEMRRGYTTVRNVTLRLPVCGPANPVAEDQGATATQREA